MARTAIENIETGEIDCCIKSWKNCKTLDVLPIRAEQPSIQWSGEQDQSVSRIRITIRIALRRYCQQRAAQNISSTAIHRFFELRCRQAHMYRQISPQTGNQSGNSQVRFQVRQPRLQIYVLNNGFKLF